MKPVIPLSDLKVGQIATVRTLLTSCDIKRRLRDLGMIEGTHVTCVLQSPWGDPMAYEIRGAFIALRKKDSEKILITI